MLHLALAPLTALAALPPTVTAASAVLAAAIAAPALGAPLVRAGTTRAPEATTITFTVLTAAAAVAAVGLSACTAGGPATRLRGSPWRARQAQSKAGDGVCALAGGRRTPALRCPACGAAVCRDAWHAGDKRGLALPIGEGPYLWKEAGAAVDQTDLPLLRRAQLDAALGLRVNYLTASVGPCCAACAGAVVSTNLLPRLAGVCGCGALALALVPWAFGPSLAGLDGESAGGGGRVQAVCLILAAWMAALAAGSAAGAAARGVLLADAHGAERKVSGGRLVERRGVGYALLRGLAGRAGVAAARLGGGGA